MGVGQAADLPTAERVGWEWALAQAQDQGTTKVIAELTRIGPPPHDVDDMLTSRKWVERFGGSFHSEMTASTLIWAALRTDEARLWDLVLFGRGNRFSLECLWPEIRGTRLTDMTEFQVPVFFLLGRHDMQVPASVVAGYFQDIHAPCKRVIWFEDAAHNLPFERPAAFVSVVAEQIPELLASPECAGARLPQDQ